MRKKRERGDQREMDGSERTREKIARETGCEIERYEGRQEREIVRIHGLGEREREREKEREREREKERER